MSLTPQQIQKMKQGAKSVQSFSPEQLMQMKNGQTAQQPKYPSALQRFFMGAGTEEGNKQYMQQKGLTAANKPGWEPGFGNAPGLSPDVTGKISGGLPVIGGTLGLVGGPVGAGIGAMAGESLKQLIGRAGGTRGTEMGLAPATKQLTGDITDIGKEGAFNVIGGKVGEYGANKVIPGILRNTKRIVTQTSGLGKDTIGTVGTWVLEQAKNYPKEVAAARSAIYAGKDVYDDFAKRAASTLGQFSKRMAGEEGLYPTIKNKIFSQYSGKSLDMTGALSDARDVITGVGSNVSSSSQKAALKSATKLINDFEKAGNYGIEAVDKFNQTLTQIIEGGKKVVPSNGRAPVKAVSDVYSKVAQGVKDAIKTPFYDQVPELGGLNAVYKDFLGTKFTLSKLKDPVMREKFVQQIMGKGNAEVRNALQLMDKELGTNIYNELRNIRAAELISPVIKGGQTPTSALVNSLFGASPAIVGQAAIKFGEKVVPTMPLIQAATKLGGYAGTQLGRLLVPKQK